MLVDKSTIHYMDPMVQREMKRYFIWIPSLQPWAGFFGERICKPLPWLGFCWFLYFLFKEKQSQFGFFSGEVLIFLGNITKGVGDVSGIKHIKLMTHDISWILFWPRKTTSTSCMFFNENRSRTADPVPIFFEKTRWNNIPVTSFPTKQPSSPKKETKAKCVWVI